MRNDLGGASYEQITGMFEGLIGIKASVLPQLSSPKKQH